jgi:hypothetical protein
VVPRDESEGISGLGLVESLLDLIWRGVGKK